MDITQSNPSREKRVPRNATCVATSTASDASNPRHLSPDAQQESQGAGNGPREDEFGKGPNVPVVSVE